MGRYVIVDLEMCRVNKKQKKETGYKYGSELIQIGAVELDEEYKVSREFSTYVKPKYGEIDGFIERLTGITNKDTSKAPSAEDAIRSFVEWLPEGAVPVSWSDSDKNQIKHETECKNIEIEGLDEYVESWLDCQRMFSEKLNSPKTYNLTEALNISGVMYTEGIHNALVDAYNTALLFAKMQTEPKLKLSAYYVTEDDTDSEWRSAFD